MKNLLTYKFEVYIFLALMSFALIFSLSSFLERPSLWFDEGITIEIARNFALFGELDVLTAPNTFSEVPYLVGTNGYTLTVPLAAFFKVFGTGLLQARIFMLFWLCATIGAIYFVTRKFFGPMSALGAVALTISFASFYGNGLTATGEMPGLFFFVMGLWLLIDKKYYFGSGVFWGLAIVSKPGVFLLLAHTAVLYIILADRKEWFKKIFKTGFGFFIPIFLWILLVFPLTLGTFYSVIEYTLNPIEIPVVTSFLDKLPKDTLNKGLIIPNTEMSDNNVVRNAKFFVSHSTFIYFSFLAGIVLLGLYLGRINSEKYRKLFFVILIYGFLTLIFLIRGPGWFRYLIGLQILLFIPLLPALKEITLKVERFFPIVMSRIQYIKTPYIAVTIICLFFILQMFQLFVLSDIPNSKGKIESISYVVDRMKEDNLVDIGIYNIPEMAAFTNPYRTYHILSPQKGLPSLGESPLLMNVPPQIIAINEGEILSDEEEIVLNDLYRQIDEIMEFYIYEKTL